ncbi:LysR substrate-binding domain-containing protein [Parendozoicomonas sp. Alg238-R29]|uniref:LysR substrate-binding domain-containing protein n=1 Tax=Parendozoicomonas sp. Alg238-R29 TaxID=2993446 RepID=UPI00248E972F|nr:LysR substrate-binding domain-containing protein [Parendozoicomonas sp. Alg238-R29]
MHITLRQFEIFRAVARTGKVTAAAKTLHISQPAASMALSELEKQLGQLFDRHHRLGLTLNDAGRALLPKASEIIDRAREIELQFSEGGHQAQGELKISASSTVGNNLLPGLVSSFKEEHSGIQVSLTISNSRDIEKQLLNFETDLAVVEGACLNPDIRVEAWREDELVIICHPGHPFAGKPNVTLNLLSDEPWVIRESGSSTRELFDEMIATRLKTPAISMVLNRAEAIKHAVASELGIACMSSIAASKSLASGSIKTIEVEDLLLKRHFYVLTHHQKYHTDALQAFHDFLMSSTEHV